MTTNAAEPPQGSPRWLCRPATCSARHRPRAFTRAPNALERDIPAGTVVHVVLGTVSSHTTPDAMRWPDRTPRWTVHVTPTSASWPKAVEGFLAKLPERRLKRGVFKSVVDLQAAIDRVIEDHNETDPNPLTWQADPNEIIAARHRGVQMLEAIQ